jgi:anthranilate phosphoribosyltransferase
MQKWLKEVARGKRGSKDLSYEDTLHVARMIIKGEATDAQIAAYFIAQRLKTESPEELLAFIHALQEDSRPFHVSTPVPDRTIDFAGPYNGRNSYAATVPSTILLADYGIPAFLHSSESLPPKYGVTIKDILDRLGVDTNLSSINLSETIRECNLGFAWTEMFCPSLRELRPLREQIGVRTLLNTAEKLLNVTKAKSLVMGAYHRTAINKIYPIFKGLSYENVFIVQGIEGSEDLPVHRNSFIYKLTGDLLDSFIVNPAEYGLLDESYEMTKKLTVQEQSDITVALLSGEKSRHYHYYYNQVLFNTGIRYYLGGVTDTIEEGIEITREQLENQSGLHQLEKWKKQQRSLTPTTLKL